MKSFLLVKTSSLGDVVHNLPVVSDIRAAFPDAAVDWVVEEAFAAIPRLHPAVQRVVRVAIRRWRGTWWRSMTRGEIRVFLDQLREKQYDAVIDTQGLFKSALIARAARGTRYGLDWRSAREPLALFYDRTFRVPWTMHAVERNRVLAARALGYSVSSRVDYGIHAAPPDPAWLPRGRYAVLLHATSAEHKLWPEPAWIGVGRHLAEQGMFCVMPWGSAAERERSVRIAAGLPGAIVPPAVQLDEAAKLLAGARAVIGVDTGLTHLAAALGAPTVGIYCATEPAATGTYGAARAANLGGVGRAPQAEDVIAALGRLAA